MNDRQNEVTFDEVQRVLNILYAKTGGDIDFEVHNKDSVDIKYYSIDDDLYRQTITLNFQEEIYNLRKDQEKKAKAEEKEKQIQEFQDKIEDLKDELAVLQSNLQDFLEENF